MLAVAFAFDVPKLEHVEQVMEGHPIKIILVQALLNIPQLHCADEHLEGEPAAITAARAVRVCLGDNHAFEPLVLGYSVVDVVFARIPSAMIRVGTVQRKSGDDLEHVRIQRAFGIVLDHIFPRVRLCERLIDGGESAFIHRVWAGRVGVALDGLGRRIGCGG
ncbi:hypothetical protein SDC9_133662 [bioreactor metagenome]|uniref:Uncharacterized protein n=1 Tax=bioreactor metagenome TaxID=1076179 RepID=A0A645DCB1_9ZZZZ